MGILYELTLISRESVRKIEIFAVEKFKIYIADIFELVAASGRNGGTTRL